MAPMYISDCVKLLLILTITVVLTFVISTASTKQCTSKKTERDSYVIKDIGIKLCQLKCAEHGQCASVEYDIETLTCRLLRDESKIEKKEGHVNLERSHSDVPTDSCQCSFGQRCLKTRSGKEVCVQASTDPKPNTVSHPPVTTQDSHTQVSASTSDANEGLTSCNTVPPAPVTTQDSDPHATPSPADRRFYNASENGDLTRVKRILSAGRVNINTRAGHNSKTPVMAAAMKGLSDVVQFLVGRGADVSLVDGDGCNVLHYACFVGDLNTVKLILSLDVVDINSRGKNSWTPMMLAGMNGHAHVVEFLLGSGADVSLVDAYGENILHLASSDGDLETVKLILSLNVLEINARDNKGKTAADAARVMGRQGVVNFLVSRGAH